MKTYVCRKMRLYNYLSERGFEFYRACRDKFNPNYTVWLYDWTEELDAAINDYYASVNDIIGKQSKS